MCAKATVESIRALAKYGVSVEDQSEVYLRSLTVMHHATRFLSVTFILHFRDRSRRFIGCASEISWNFISLLDVEENGGRLIDNFLYSETKVFDYIVIVKFN